MNARGAPILARSGLFCGEHQMAKPTPKAYGDMTLDDVRGLIKEVRAQGLQIQSHYKRLEQEYSDWEDRVNELDKIIYQAELDTGLVKEEIYKQPNELDDINIDGLDLDEFNLEDKPIDKNESILDI